MDEGSPARGRQLHPLFGDLNLYEWPVVNVLMHERDHQGRIRTLLAHLRG